MAQNYFLHSLRALLVSLCLAILTSSFVRAESEIDIAEIFNDGPEHQVTTLRNPRPNSKIAENVTVITAADIERLNAHTLAEVLQAVPGIQLDQIQNPGNFTFFSIQGTTSRHIQVQIDNVPQNFLSNDGIAVLGSIPVQMIERVEIVKGSASTAWGSALGGVVNIITKSPDSEHKNSGMVSGSIGSRDTTDSRAELSGTLDRFGYYLTGGNIRSDGQTPGTQVRFNHGFGKFTYDLPSKGKFTFGLDLRDNSYGLENSTLYDYRDSGASRFASGYLAFSYPLTNRLLLDLNSYAGQREMSTKWGALTIPDLFLNATTRETYQGAKLGLTWGDAEAGLSAGLDYEHNDIRQRETVHLDPVGNANLALERWSSYLNGIWTVGKLSLLPGFRFDHISQLDNITSYTLGATYQLTDSTILRAYAAKGYGLPIISNLSIMNNQRKNQNVQTVQTGIETTAIPYFWLKGSLFYNNISDIQSIDTSAFPSVITLHEQVRQGAELELRTSPLYGLALTGGYTFSDSRDKATNAELTSVESGPRQNVKLGLNYDNTDFGLRGTLTGSYVWWKSPDYNNANTANVIWDLHLNWKLKPVSKLSPELFFSIHNIFNGEQYIVDFRPNAPRWFDGGLRVNF